ncbi:MAG: hypothetical protein V3R96_05020 [Dehalococcoidales bacterium]
MINITGKARRELERILNSRVDMPQARLRLIDRGEDELGLGIDIEMPGDELVEHNGSTVLVVERGLAKRLKGITIDVDNTPEGFQLVLCHQTGEQRQN